jgi:hypothetical protein
MKKLLFIMAVSIALFATSCQKGPGEGGKSKITGKVNTENYNTLNNMSDTYVLKSEYPATDKDVYLVFGDDISYGMKTKTNPDGQFEFDYMRAGDYTIYVESKDTTRTSISGITTMHKTISLGKKETGDAGTIVIYN